MDAVVERLSRIKSVVREVSILGSRVGILGSRADIGGSRVDMLGSGGSCLPSTPVFPLWGSVAAALAGTSWCWRGIIGVVRCRRGDNVRMCTKIDSACRGKVTRLVAAET